MIIQSYDHCYEVIRELDRTSRMSEFVCKEQQQEVYLLVRIAEPTLAKRFTLFLEEKVKKSGYSDLKECFWWKGAFFIALTYSLNQTLADRLAVRHCDKKERAEIARRLLEQLLLRNPHPYFMRNALRPDMITVADSLDLAWNYHPDEVRTFDYCTMEAVDIRLTEVMKLLFKEELSKREYPLLEHYLSVLGEGKMSDYLELYREFMPVYQTLCEEGQEQLHQTFLQRLWEVCKKIGGKPDSLKGYLRLGKKYVAKKLVVVFIMLTIPLMVLLFLFFMRIVYPWVQSRFLIKTMVMYSQDTEGYTGKVRLVGDTEADNVIFVGTLTEGQINGQGTLYDWEGNTIYQGEFLADRYSGIGESYYRNGNVQYSGEFVGGQYEGTGKLYHETGSLLYEGGFSQGLYQGNGLLYRFGKLLYEGEFSRGLYDGSGILYYPDGRIQYRGSFSQGLYEGVGVLFYENGTASYEGEFLQGKRSGSGKAYGENGEPVYVGSFSRDQYEGEGIMYEDGMIVGQGSFHQGVLTSGDVIYYDGQGKLLYQGGISNGHYDGEGKLFSEGILIYEGSFSEGERHGSGKEYQEVTALLLYDGTFEHGQYSGEGKLYDPETGYLIYEGSFRENRCNGHGKRYDKGILIYEGEFFQDKYSGQGTLYDPNTGEKSFEGIFYEGQLQYISVEPNQENEAQNTVAENGAE